MKGALAAAQSALTACGCTPLALFNTLVPKDSRAKLVIRNAPYGARPRQRIDVYRPRVGAHRPLPIIVFFYGGSWNSGKKSGYSFAGRALAARGFVVAIPDYRLVPEVHYPAFLEDSAAAVRWVIRHSAELGGDPERIVIAGHSAGAYNGAMLSFDPRWLGTDQRRVRRAIDRALAGTVRAPA